MTAVKESFILSVFCRIIRWIWAQLTGCFIGRAVAAVWRAGRGSAFVRFFRREGRLDKVWSQSQGYRIFDAVLNAPGTFGKFLRRKTEKYGNSWVFGLLGFFGRHLAFVGGLFFLGMILCFNSMWNNLYATVAVLALLMLVYVGAARRKERAINTDAVGPYMPLYILLVLFAFFSSPDRGDSLRFLLFQLTGILIVYLMVSGLRSTKQLRTLIYFVLTAVTLVSLYGCYQRILGVEPDESLVDMSLELNKNMPGRIYGTFANPNNFAELLVLTIPLYIAVILSEKRRNVRLLAMLALLPPILAIAMTYSRSGWIGLVIAIVLFVALKDWRLLPVLVILGILALPFLPQSIMNRILSIGVLEDTSTSYRFEIYKEFYLLLKDYWLGGVGLGSDVVYSTIKSGYPQMANGYFPVHAHNNYIQVWAEMGILGLFAYLGLLLNNFKKGIRAVCSRRMNTEAENYTAALVSSLAGIMVISIAEYTWFYPRVQFCFWLVVGLIAACVAVGKREVKPLG